MRAARSGVFPRSGAVAGSAMLRLSARELLLRMPPLSKPLFEEGIFVYLYLKCRTESDVMFDLGLHFMIEAQKVFLRKLRHK
jgi:hypothetical protein